MVPRTGDFREVRGGWSSVYWSALWGVDLHHDWWQHIGGKGLKWPDENLQMSEGERRQAGEGKERFDSWRLTQRECRRPNRAWMAAGTMALLMEPFSRDTIQGLSASVAIFQEGSGEWGSVLGPAAVVLSLTCAPAPEGSFRRPEHTLACRLLSTVHYYPLYGWQLKGLD